MRVIIVGLGVQGAKRLLAAGADAVATIDPVNPKADFKDISDVPLDDYDGVLLCVPDEAKVELIENLLANGKHVLVEKPLVATENKPLLRLKELSEKNKTTCYTAYNHRFEPHFIATKDLLDSGELGEVYRCRMFYGNGTARLVRDSEWRDQGAGVLPDLASHLLDTVCYWFGQVTGPFHVISAERFENKAFDHVVVGARGRPVLELEITLLSWRNHFTCDIFAEKGSVHIESLSKWGGSTLTVRTRKFPSGRPDERRETLGTEPLDKTWDLEYTHFKKLCETGTSNIDNDLWLNPVINGLSRDALEGRFG